MRQLPILRNYQEPAVEQAVYFFNSNKIQKPKIIVAPTAAGKSIIIAATAAQLSKKVLVLQPSAELLKQNFEKYLLYDDNCSAFSASVRQKKLAKVTFATIGTIVSCPELFAEYECLIVDECHLYSPSNESMFGKFLDANPQLKILGLTATPFRLKSSRESSKLVMIHNSNIYNGYQHITQIQEIAPKFWSKINYHFENGKSNILRMNSTGADFTDRSLQMYGDSVEGFIDQVIKIDMTIPTLIFVPSVAQAERLAKKYGSIAGFVCGTSNKKDREQAIKLFKSEEITLMFNVGVFSVGFDFPGLRRIIDAVPTVSLAKHYQKIGRITRVHPLGLHIVKDYYDFGGNTMRFGYMENLEIRKMGTTYHFFSGDKQITGVNLNDLVIFDTGKKKEVVEKFDDMVVHFGRFKGKKISEIEMWWLSWAVDNITSNEKLVKNIKIYIKKVDEQKRAQTMSGRWV